MGKVSDALTAAKAMFQSMTTAPKQVYISPDDYKNYNLSNLPVVLVSEQVNNDNTARRQTLGGGLIIAWDIEVLLFIQKGTITTDAEGAEAEALTRLWTQRILKEIYQKVNFTLSGTVISFAFEEVTYRTGHIALGSDVYWGTRFTVPVTQQIER